MNKSTQNCETCGEKLDPGERHIPVGLKPGYGARRIHVKCATPDTPMSTESRAEFNSWQIGKLLEENSSLRDAMDVLRDEMDVLRRDRETTG